MCQPPRALAAPVCSPQWLRDDFIHDLQLDQLRGSDAQRLSCLQQQQQQKQVRLVVTLSRFTHLASSCQLVLLLSVTEGTEQTNEQLPPPPPAQHPPSCQALTLEPHCSWLAGVAAPSSRWPRPQLHRPPKVAPLVLALWLPPDDHGHSHAPRGDSLGERHTAATQGHHVTVNVQGS